LRSKQLGNDHVPVFDPGEKALETLNSSLTQRHIAGAKFEAIGGFSWVRLEYFTYFNVQTKQYERSDASEQVEVTSLVGDVALVSGQPFVHAHVCVGTRECQAHAGHLGEAMVRPTLELFLTVLNGELTRKVDPQYRPNGAPAIAPVHLDSFT
jgi:predicted DNA-binding protein with PD1-like motif